MKTKLYLPIVLWHKWFILVAGLKVGFPFWRLLIHDWTKFLPCEYGVYRRKFTGKKYSEDEWEKAKWHHYINNPHHYQYWTISGLPTPMPEIFIKEMVLDWMAASRGYHGNWDIQKWLDENYTELVLHPDTLKKLKPVLKSHGFNWPKD